MCHVDSTGAMEKSKWIYNTDSDQWCFVDKTEKLDYRFSWNEKDIIYSFLSTWCGRKYVAAEWDKAWAEIFENTELEGKTIDEVWKMYLSDPFSKSSARVYSYGSKSDLISDYNVREFLAR